jgi:beta-lactam-binding protein with PASTA domain
VGEKMIKYKDVMAKLDAYLETVTLEQLDKDLKKAGFDVEAYEKQKDCSQSAVDGRVIKRVICSGREIEKCRPCTHMVPHEKEPDADGDNCTTWMHCAFVGKKVRCIKVL